MTKVALVTGAGSGIGKVIATLFVQQGIKTAIVDIDGEKARQLAADLRGSPGEVLSLAGDVGSTEEVERVVSETVRAFGEISIVVNNAGIQTERPFLELPVADWDSVINTNLKGTFLVSQASAKAMVRDSVAGRIVNITSVHQDMPRSGIAHYAASKGGVQMLTKVMAVELAEYGITVNCVAPGAVATPMNQPFLDSPSLVKEFSARVPVGRIASPEEIARAVLFLVEDDSSYITGTTIYVDGGVLLVGPPGSASEVR